jgi:hypothetical protein
MRFYGFLATRCRTETLPRCRRALGTTPRPVPTASDDASTRVSLPPCPACGGGDGRHRTTHRTPLAVQAWMDRLALDSS